MPDQYIEIEWNGVRTRVLVQSNGWVQSHTDFPNGGSLSTVHSPKFEGSWMDAVAAEEKRARDVMLTKLYRKIITDGNPFRRPKPDADAEYDRDVRGE